ncbi:ATP-binding cassette domain-containing protein [Mycoplasma feriruminatoris]|uniref:ATP-binding cassette domain-containing protein n=1 Tax=Mycoplasma feriruminatoris TaxID=1179777 RepID=UPI0002A4F93C|nr:ATP-binding cassette domain-containing protein [Mycoplasma feriruminatoris]UKS54376.1 ABC transporter family protein [Mycoplasma feriruminatoris]VZK65555.1 Oligopeptide transport ATP-binding protein OppF [Mycoplasma feriruminatoris]VZR75698.1 Oligopeptide transport ATP-binding protein OppF [Mycoplasma feriruminatoris]VZR98295.1 Oligopeptide transport ATP-binding protein OppF [Mycoplasma feriruminatoris]
MKENKKEAILKVRDLLIEFGNGRNKLKAVKGVTFDVYKGETFGLVGESGSGKTTIGRAIIGIQPVSDGAIYFENKLLRGKSPDVYKINQKIARHLYIMQQNQLTTSLSLNDYSNEFKRVYYKYVQSKFFDFKTQELKDYEDGKSRKIKEGVNLNTTKLVSVKKNANLSIIIQAITDNLKRLLKIIRLQEKASRITKNISKHTGVKLELQEAINKYQDFVHSSILKTKDLENTIYTTLQEMLAIRNAVNEGKYTSVTKFFDDMGAKLKLVIKSQKLISPQLEEASYDQLMNLALTCPKSKNSYYLKKLQQRIEYLTLNNKTELAEEYKSVINTVENSDFYQNLKTAEIFKSPSKKELRESKKDMQMIFQDPSSSLNERMAVEEIIKEGLDNFPELYTNEQVRVAYQQWFNTKNPENKITDILEIDKKDIKRFLINQLLETVGLLPEHLSRYPHEFSGGQRQRIGIARALIMKPKFVVADEPISALDVSIRAQIMNLLAKFQKQFDLTYIFIAHDLSVVRFATDRIAVIYRGDIVELAESDELFELPLHPYTRSLLSAIPLPDPVQESKKVHFVYNPEVEHYDYLVDFPKWVEVSKGHFVYANEREVKVYKKQIKAYKDELKLKSKTKM